MGRNANIFLGTMATALITAGIAAQTGTVHLPKSGRAPAAVSIDQKATPQAAKPKPSPVPSPTPTPPPQPQPNDGDEG